MKPTRSLVFSLLLTLAACGGGGGGGSTTTTPPNTGGGTTPTPTTYTVSTQPATGTSFSINSQVIEANKTATFNVILAAGYKDLHATGCGIDFSKAEAGSYPVTTVGITAACTITATATKIATPSSYTVTLSAAEGALFYAGASLVVNPGASFITNVELKSGYKDLRVTGCGVDLSSQNAGSSQIISPAINADCTLSATTTRITSTDGPYTLYGIGQPTASDFLGSTNSFDVEVRASGKFDSLRAVVYDGIIDGVTEFAARETLMVSKGNGVYTARITLPVLTKLYKYSGQMGSQQVYIRAYDAAGVEIARAPGSIESAVITHTIVNPAVQASPLTQCAPNASRNGNIVNFIGNKGDEAGLLAALRECVDTSQLDFVMQFVIGNPMQYVGGYESSVSNDVEGLMVPIKSSGITGFPRLRSFQTIGPGLMDCGADSCLHEVMHTWGLFYKKDGVDLTGGTGIHIGPSNVDGMLGAASYLRIEADGSATVDNSARPKTGRYDPLEQYLAGWRDASEVPPRYFALNKSYFLDQGTKIPKSDLTLVSPAWLASQFGAHKTVNGTPFQKDFNMVMVVISSAPLAPAEVAHFSIISRHFESTNGPETILAPNRFTMSTNASFYYATEGRATIKTRVVPKP